jgi:hypothetical protein
MLTLDLQILGQRHKDLKNGLSAPPKPTLRQHHQPGHQAALVPGHARHEAPQLRQHRGPRKGVGDLSSLSRLDRRAVRPGAELGRCRVDQEALGRQADPQGHHGRRRRALAADSGADALIVSATTAGDSSTVRPRRSRPCPPSRKTWARRIEVWMDGGIRSGQDVLKAWALGARGTLIGRAFLYGLGAMGEEGVTKALQIIHKELDLTMAFCGHTKIEHGRPRHPAAGHLRDRVASTGLRAKSETGRRRCCTAGTLPLCRPRLNHGHALLAAAVGEALRHHRALRLALQGVVADLRGRVQAFLDVALLQPAFALFCEWWAHTPAKQSACSSSRTDSAFIWRWLTRPRMASTLPVMPSRFCTWWPTSCAMT